MPPPPGTPTEPRSMRGAQPSFPLSNPSSHANSPGKRDRNDSFGHRTDRPPATATDGDVIMGNTSEAQRMPPPPRPPTTALAAEPPIPRLRSLAPAIFVPISKILPSEEAMEEFVALARTDRVAHMRKALEQCDRHAAAVRGNIPALFRREDARLMQVARAEDAAAGYGREDPRYDPQMRHGVSWWPASKADMERMIANMAAPAPPPPPPPPAKLSSSDVVAKVLHAERGRSGSRGGTHAPGDVIGHVPEPSFTHRPVTTPRAHAAREALMLVGKATAELHGYDAHISARRDERRRALDREIAQRSRSQPPVARVAPMAPMGISVREAEMDRSVRPPTSHNTTTTTDDTKGQSGGDGDGEQKQKTTPRGNGRHKRSCRP
ncbi:hypothetical protein ISF_06368 [Cordyceps fumosorosea ARSEF 2679]|uniref:Uncharacterized protein n=1 Tax=Cordyceps fumosorosea (strain ARSEF 2679) TaxID=1081104 RepID=A0A167SAS7_CORFA|nr:hypothetical protein ISF_06368 [Cordyceps fumosorosea ARSEF 2679]OAA59433.1 hypothetical protein ISF_06368 [Cordyceps fumosorosea ARSEF 2679]